MSTRRPRVRPLRRTVSSSALSFRAVAPRPLAGAIARALRSADTSRTPAPRPRGAPSALLAGTLLLSLSVTLPAQAQTWTGAVSDDWFAAGNWDTGQVPTATDLAVVDAGGGNAPVIAGGDASTAGLWVGSTGTGATLGILDGGSLTSRAQVIIGLAQGGQGSMTVDGTGSSFQVIANPAAPDNGADLNVGFGGTGSLTVSNGATVSADRRVVLAVSPTSIGELTVDGIGSTVSAPVVIAGFEGDGRMTVSNGGIVRNDFGVVGAFAGSTGIAIVDGAGSLWDNGIEMAVGRDDSGQLIVRNGGAVLSGLSRMAFAAGARGLATVSGAGSRWASSTLFVGENGEAELAIADGGEVSAFNATLGVAAGASGDVAVDGSGSAFDVSNDLVVGGSGSGRLTVNDGAIVSADRQIAVGTFQSSVGEMTVDGAGSTASARFVTAGFGGNGRMTISNGGAVRNDFGSIGAFAGSAGVVVIEGAGSIWENRSALDIGGSGSGTLAIADGGQVDSAESRIGASGGSSGAVSVSGGGSLWNAGALYVGDQAGGTLDVFGGGQVNSGTAILGEGAAVQGTATVRGAGARWENEFFLVVGNGGRGTLDILEGGVVDSSALVIGSLVGATGMLTVDGAGSQLLGDAIAIGELGQGTLAVTAGGNVAADLLSVGQDNQGTLAVAGGGSAIAGDMAIGEFATGAGTATVGGAGSRLEVAELLQVGALGGGQMDVADGGVVEVGADEDGRSLIIGVADGSSGGVSVAGAGSRLTTAGTTTVGDFGTGSLAIGAGGAVDSQGGASVGLNGSGQGSVTVSGAGSLWNVGDGIGVGALGAGSLDIVGGGTVSTALMTIGGAESGVGRVTVDGAGSTLDMSGNLLVSSNGAGSLLVTGGGLVRSGFGSLGFFTSGTDGDVRITGAGSRWDIANTLKVGLVSGTGTVTVSDGGALSAGGGITLAEGNIQGGTPSAGTLNIGAGVGEAAAGAGTIDTPTLTFGPGAATLTFNHTDTGYTFGATLTGTGTLNHLAGTTTLTGIGDASGTLAVDGGTLRVDGTLGAMTTTVASGATLGGAGTLAGDVTVLDGGVLSPGSSAGTLTLGSLTLSSGAILDYELGQAGVIGSGVNDLIEISGDLTLDGRLDVTDIGGFGAGVYRLMNYGGTLTDNGLDLGALPVGSDAQDLFLQTAIGGQVNLVNSAGLALSFWDGAIAGERNNGAVDGGDGVWDAGNDNWTAADGTVNGRWDAGTFAVFGGTGGSVSVVGEQAVAGIQFMAGYTLDAGVDGALRIDGAASVIRVDPDVTATIAAPITGAGGLVKTDTGTLVLSGNNTYTGGTRIDLGTLQVASDGNLGDAAGALSFDGGTLRNTAAFTTARAVTLLAGGGTFDTAADLTVSGSVDGAGALTKAGTGTLTLTGANTYAGGTRLLDGTLSVASDANLGDAAGVLTLAGGTLQTTAAFDAGRDVVLGGGTLQTDAALGLSGAVSGGAALVKTGAGTLTLTGANTYTGGTRVQAGTLIGDADAIRGNLANDGTVVFDQAVDATFAGAIAGDGAMVKRGAGALTLGAASALDWSIDAGTLVAQPARFGGDAAIASGATFRFAEATGSYAGTLSGEGAFEIAAGDGVFALTGDSAGFAGGTLLETGTLRLDGALGGLTTIAGGATLAGSGRLGSVDNAGTVAAGDSIGTLTLTGDYLHRAGATLLAEIEPGGSSDLLDVAGSATLEGGTVDIVKLPGQYAGGTRYTLIDAAGGVTGTFGTLDQDLPFLDLLLVYAPNQVFLDVLRNDVDFDIVCGDGSFNQCQVAGALDRIGDGEAITPDLEAVLTEVTTLTLDQARAGFDRLSGEAHASFAGAMLEGHALYGQTVTRRLADRREAIGADRLHGGVWARGYGAGSELDGDGNAAGADLELYGVAAGVDAWATEGWLIGASVNTLTLDADFRAGDGGEADAKTLALYTSVQGERAYLDAVGSYAWWDSEIERRIEVGSLRRSASSDYGSHRFAAYVEAGMRFGFAGGALQPLIAAEWSLLSTEGFREAGADDVSLVGRAQNVERTVASAGVRWSGEYGGGEWTWVPKVEARWLHTFGDLDAELGVAFAGAPDIGYRVRGVTVPEDRGLLGLGLLARREALDLFVDLDLQAGDGYEAASLGAGMRWRW